MSIPVVYSPHPTAKHIFRDVMPQGLSVAEIVARVPTLTRALRKICRVLINGEEVPRDWWTRVRPRSGRPIAVVIVVAPAGGKGVKNVISIVATIALIAVTTFISAGGLGPAGLGIAGNLFAAGSTSAALLAGAVGILGRFAIMALAPPAGRDRPRDNAAPELGNAGAEGNIIAPGAALMLAAGEKKVFPAMAMAPLIDLSRDSEIVEMVYMLAGPHRLRDLRVEGAPAVEIEGLQSEIVEGFDNQPPQSLINRYGKQDTPQLELSAHKRDRADPRRLEIQSLPELNYPQWHIVTSALDPDEIWLTFIWPQGLINPGFPTLSYVMPLRLRMRIAGTDTWVNLPELHFSFNKAGPIRRVVKLKWLGAAAADTAFTFGAWHSYHTVPVTQNQTPVGVGGWSAHSSFVGGTDYNETQNVERIYEGFNIFLDPTAFPRGTRWEVGLKRGALLRPDQFTPATYETVGAGNVVDQFGHVEGAASVLYVPPDPIYNFYSKDIPDQLVLQRAASVKNATPTPKRGCATISLVGSNINIAQVSCLAAAYVHDWDGAAWADLVVTDNPAPHARAVLAGPLTLPDDRVPEEIIDDAEFLELRSLAAANSLKVSASFDGTTGREVLAVLLAAAYARPRQSDTYGVIIDKDTSGLDPVQIFTPRNAGNFRLTKSFADLPDAFMVRFQNRANDFVAEEVLVARPGLDPGEIISIAAADAVAVADKIQVQDRFAYDLAVNQARDVMGFFDTNVQAIACRAGDLIGVNHLILSRHAGQARLKQVVYTGADITGLVLDDYVGIPSQSDFLNWPDVLALNDVLAQGQKLAAAIQLIDGTQLVVGLAGPEGESNTVTLSSPVSPNGFYTDGETAPLPPASLLVVIGPEETIYTRFKVHSMQPLGWFNTRIAVVPEAAEHLPF